MLEILYRDNDIVVCIKPVGVLSERDGNKQSMPKLLCEELSLDEVYSVHRLDKNVGGIMIWALNSDAASKLCKQINDGRVIKEYAALVLGVPTPDVGEMTNLLFHDSKINKTYAVSRMRKGVRMATLDYILLETKDNVSLVKVHLRSGRTHQIRAQFAAHGWPLMGDGRYGSGDQDDKPMLFACILKFKHPTTKKSMSFTKVPEIGAFPQFALNKLFTE